MKTVMHLLLMSALFLFAGAAAAQQESIESETFSEAEMEQILAPIALYPDTVLSHILIAATYPLEVVQAERWVSRHPELEGSDAVEAVEDKDWDPSVRALVAFPQLLKRLSEDLEWTEKLGNAFLQDEKKLLASVQTLRQRAYQEGSLDDLDKVSVTRENETIIIEPVEREVVYVPYYDTRRVYGAWRWSNYPPVYWDCPYHSHHYYGYRHDPFYWGPRFHLSFGFFFSSFHWRNQHIVRIPRRHYNPRRHYRHHQIVRHRDARRWVHNPNHRRHVTYPRGYNNGGYNRLDRVSSEGIGATPRAVESRNTRIDPRTTQPERIRRELRQGRSHTGGQNYRTNGYSSQRMPASTSSRSAASTSNQAQRQAAPSGASARNLPGSPVVRVPPAVRAPRVDSRRQPSPSVRATPPVRTPRVDNSRQSAPVVQQSAPKPAASPRVEARPQHRKSNAHPRAGSTVRGTQRSHPR